MPLELFLGAENDMASYRRDELSVQRETAEVWAAVCDSNESKGVETLFGGEVLSSWLYTWQPPFGDNGELLAMPLLSLIELENTQDYPSEDRQMFSDQVLQEQIRSLTWMKNKDAGKLW